MKKLTGSYYTPREIADFMWSHVAKSINPRGEKIYILEPSCGTGVFVQSIPEIRKNVILNAIEINNNALKIAKEQTKKNSNYIVNYINTDFLFIDDCKHYDIVIGNPPYIGRKRLNYEQIQKCQQIHQTADLSEKTIKNIWTAFLIKSTYQLNKDGILALVLPVELLQVHYAKELQNFLKNEFQFLEIVTFDNLVFPSIGQDIVLLFAYKKANSSGIAHAQIESVEHLSQKISFKTKKDSLNNHIKWSSFYLSNSDLRYLSNLRSKFKSISDFCTTTPGVVTAANDFFILNHSTAEEFQLKEFCQPIVRKSQFIQDNLILDDVLFNTIKKSNYPCFLLSVGKNGHNNLNEKVIDYLNIGLNMKIHERYKCKRRTPWYNIPVGPIAPGVFFKRSHHYPKLLVNKIGCSFTDSAYYIFPQESFNIESIVFSFYNPLTLIFSELLGRYYASGVLELVPAEFRNLPLSYRYKNTIGFNHFANDFRMYDNTFKYFWSKAEYFQEELQIDHSNFRKIMEIYQQLLKRRLRKHYERHKEEHFINTYTS